MFLNLSPVFSDSESQAWPSGTPEKAQYSQCIRACNWSDAFSQYVVSGAFGQNAFAFYTVTDQKMDSWEEEREEQRERVTKKRNAAQCCNMMFMNH